MTTPIDTRSRRWPWPAAAVALGVAFTLAMAAPPDTVQGELARIMYVHVPAAWLAYLAFTVTLIGSIGYLVTRRLSWDRLAGSSGEVGVYLTALLIALGMIWGKPTWGVWWTWDARLTLTAIMFFVYVGYVALRRTTSDPHGRARRSAVLGVVGVVLIPLVHFSVTWWRTLHQPPSIIRPDGPQIDDPLMLAALIGGTAAFTVVYAALVTKRMELDRLQLALAEARAAADTRVAGDAVIAPGLAEDWGLGR